MPAAWKSTHPEVLAWWAEMQEAAASFRETVKAVEEETGMGVVMRRGIGSHIPMGMSYDHTNAKPPAGWKWGWGDRYNDFIQPVKGTRGTEAEALLKRIADAYVDIRATAEERFGMPSAHFPVDSDRVYSPGFFEHDNVIWAFWGDYDFDPESEERRRRRDLGVGESEAFPGKRATVLEYFGPAKLSEYHAVREAIEAEDDQEEEA
jgi:hypothetical protein